jgi:hypothetical protein
VAPFWREEIPAFRDTIPPERWVAVIVPEKGPADPGGGPHPAMEQKRCPAFAIHATQRQAVVDELEAAILASDPDQVEPLDG